MRSITGLKSNPNDDPLSPGENEPPPTRLAAPAESNELIEIDEATFVASLNKMDNPD